MSANPAALEALIESLRCLPGVGPKSAARMAYHLLQHDRNGAERLSAALHQALTALQRCARCQTFTEDEVCATCRDTSRDVRQLCVVETPADLGAVEQTGMYHGLYFVLMGHLSPLDGIGPDEIGLTQLFERARDPQLEEVILATNFTNEGEATAHVIASRLREFGLRVTRLARGVPAGSELEYTDLGTIAHAIVDRRKALA